MAALLWCPLLALVSTFFYRCAEAGLRTELNRTLLAYNSDFNICKGVTNSSGHESKLAADRACEQAFASLDRVGLNNCRGWRRAACRHIRGDEHYQCTCLISYCDDYSVRNHVVRTFRDCSPAIWAQELAMQRRAAPSATLQQHRGYFDNALREAHSRRANYLDLVSGLRSSSSANPGGGASTSSGAHAGGRAGLYASGYGNPSTSHQYAQGGSREEIPDTVGGVSAALPKPYACRKCAGKFRSARALYSHDRSHHTLINTHCHHCNLTYAYKKGYVAHLRDVHPEIFAEETGKNVDPARVEALMPHQCNFCLRRYSSQHGLEDHKKSHTTDETKCPACTRTFSTKAILKSHMGKVHGTVIVSIAEPAAPRRGITIREPATGDFVCGECGKSYALKSGLRDHVKSHKDMETRCIDCQQTFSTRKSYKVHMQRRHPDVAEAESAAANLQHIKENPEKCPRCPKRFKSDRGLRDHMAVHDDKTKCDKCGRTLPRKSSLSAHKRKEHPE